MKEIDQTKLFFILAPDRSGTSILQELMNTFQNFCNTEESRIAGPDSPSCWEHVYRMNDFSYIEKFIVENWTDEFFVEKSPPSINCLSQISKRYPDANFIFLKRNPLKILLSQLNLHYGISEMGTRKEDLPNLKNKNSAFLHFQRIMVRRLLDMISIQVRYKENFKNKIEIRYEDLVNSLDENLELLQNQFHIKPNFKKAHEQIDSPSYSSSFRYGLKEIDDELAKSIVKLCNKLWNYD